MKKSIFQNGQSVYGVDYSNRPDCVEVVDITYEQFLEETRHVVEEVEEVEELETEETENEEILEN